MEITHEQKLEIIREYLRDRSSRGGKTTKERNPDHFKEMNRKSQETKRLKKEQQTCQTTNEEV